MKKFHIRIVGGWCGNRMVMIRDYLADLLDENGYDVKLDQQSIWENNAPPFFADMVLQLFAAFSADELGGPMLSIRPFLKDLEDPETLVKIFEMLEEHYPVITDLPVGKNPFAVLAE